MDFNKKVKEIEYTIKKGHYQSAFQSIAIIFEYTLKYLYKEAIPNLSQDKKEKLLDAEKKIGTGRSISDFGLGQLLGLYKKINLLDTLKKDIGLPIILFKIESLEPIVEIRNNIIHRAFEPNKISVDYAYNQLICLLTETNLLKNQTKTNNKFSLPVLLIFFCSLAYPIYYIYKSNNDTEKIEIVKNISPITIPSINYPINKDSEVKIINNSDYIEKTKVTPEIKSSLTLNSNNKSSDKIVSTQIPVLIKTINTSKSNIPSPDKKVIYEKSQITNNSFNKKTGLKKIKRITSDQPAINTVKQSKAIDKKSKAKITYDPKPRNLINPDKKVLIQAVSSKATDNSLVDNQQKNNFPKLAVLYFDNNSSDKSLDSLNKGLAEMIITDLKKIKNINIVEREQLNLVLKELDLQSSDKFDIESSQQIGKLLGVEYLLTGSFFELFNNFRIDAKIIKVETGEIVNSEGLNGSKEKFYEMQKDLVIKIAENFNLSNSIKNDKSNLPWKDIISYSDAVELYDQGNKAEAQNKAMDILKNNPDSIQANELLAKF